jgi:hypothetical protein
MTTSYTDDTDERPKRQFEGIFIPDSALKLVTDRTINASELLLLMTIRSLTKKGVGCFASNQFLAKCIGYDNPQSIGNMLAKLKRLKLVKQLSFDGKTRLLETKWKRTKIKESQHP